jgi:hypothetical protein
MESHTVMLRGIRYAFTLPAVHICIALETPLMLLCGLVSLLAGLQFPLLQRDSC